MMMTTAAAIARGFLLLGHGFDLFSLLMHAHVTIVFDPLLRVIRLTITTSG
jgi:hypothetical protein